MNEWDRALIGEVVRVVGGGTPARTNPDYYGGDIPWVTPKDMKSWHIDKAQVNITQEGLEHSSTRLVPANSVLIVVRSGVLKHTLPVSLNRRPVAINQDLKALVCSDRIDPNYLARFIKERSGHILQWVRATTADNFPIDNLKKLPVPLPPLNEQRRIAAVLDKVDALRAKRRESIALLDDLIQSVFLDMFGDPQRNTKNWTRVSLGELINNGPQNGIYKPSSRYGTGTPIVRIDAFYDGVIKNPSSLKRVELEANEIDRYLLHPGDVLINRVNSLEYLGKCALVPHLPEPTVFESNMMRFSLKRDVVEPGYLVQFLQTRYVKSQIMSAAKNAVNQSSINQRDVRGIQVNIPPIANQQAYLSQVSAINSLKEAHRAHLARLDELFASLQHRAFRGELFSDAA